MAAALLILASVSQPPPPPPPAPVVSQLIANDQVCVSRESAADSGMDEIACLQAAFESKKPCFSHFPGIGTCFLCRTCSEHDFEAQIGFQMYSATWVYSPVPPPPPSPPPVPPPVPPPPGPPPYPPPPSPPPLPPPPHPPHPSPPPPVPPPPSVPPRPPPPSPPPAPPAPFTFRTMQSGAQCAHRRVSKANVEDAHNCMLFAAASTLMPRNYCFAFSRTARACYVCVGCESVHLAPYDLFRWFDTYSPPPSSPPPLPPPPPSTPPPPSPSPPPPMPPVPPRTPPPTCSNTCSAAFNGRCDEDEGTCIPGTDCADCGLEWGDEWAPLCAHFGPCWDAQEAPATPELFAVWIISLFLCAAATLRSMVDSMRARCFFRDGPLMPESLDARLLFRRARCLRYFAVCCLILSAVTFIVWLEQMHPSMDAFQDGHNASMMKLPNNTAMNAPGSDIIGTIGELHIVHVSYNFTEGVFAEAHNRGLTEVQTRLLLGTLLFAVVTILILAVLWCRRLQSRRQPSASEVQNLMDIELPAFSRNASVVDAANDLIDIAPEMPMASIMSPQLLQQPQPRMDVALSVVSTGSVHLNRITNSFSDEQVIGRGAFGTVYRSTSMEMIEPSIRLLMPAFCERPCAVKRLATDGDLASLVNELQVLASCRHENVLPVLAFCFEVHCKCLVTPLMHGGSLNDRLLLSANQSHSTLIRWEDCIRVLRDVARALAYLHQSTDVKPAIFHRDVKPSNILLDTALNAKLGDLGVAKARLGEDIPTMSLGTHVQGSPGYIDPLYINSGRVSETTDGYALGVTMLVCMTQRPATDGPLTEACAELLASPTGCTEAVYAEAGVWWPISIAIEVAQLIAGLTHPRREDRTTVNEVVHSLEALATASDLPAGVVDNAPARTVKECLVCMEAIREVRFGPCGHSACCSACADVIMTRGDPCPSCRSPIERVHACGEHVAEEDTFMLVT